MALWGNNDNVSSAGIVTCDYVTTDVYGNVVVNGWGTLFGQVGSAKTGDVIRFGRGDSTYVGDAVIVSIASTQQLSIASTSGLSGAAIAGANFTISELPKYTVGDYSFSNALDSAPTLTNFGVTGTATTNSPVGYSTIYLATAGIDVVVGDTFLNDGNDLLVIAVNSENVGLGTTISVGISTGDTLEFKRYVGGYSRDVYGVAGAGVTAAYETKYALDHAGWVGVTTYVDCHGELRVKKEVLVAMSGITTGNAPIYDGNPLV
ncbi:MAG: hypothetical protein ACO3CQ_00360 [Candidatus Nanopelagicaceae bacterium]